MRWGLWGGLAAVVLVVGGGTMGYLMDSKTSAPLSPLALLQHTNRVEQATLLGQLIQENSELGGTHGVMTPALVGVHVTHGLAQPNRVVGVQTAWHRLRRSLSDPPSDILSAPLSASVWQAGWQQAAQDIMGVLGNDPLAVVSRAGPGSAPAFAKLEQIAYTGVGDEISGHHWSVSMIADVSPHITIYPAPRRVAGEPPVVLLMRVPVLVTQRTALANPVNLSQTLSRTVAQSGVALMALTHVQGRYQWWVNAIQTRRPHAVTFSPVLGPERG